MSKQAIDGLFNINKPIGITSHDVVAAVRRITGVKRVGHAGTLDPLATGVLVVCVGQATRLVEYIAGSSKTYWAEIVLGVETETYDAEGVIVRTSDAGAITRERVKQAMASLVGHIEQRPPAYSAIKRGGTPLYRLARQGAEVDLPVRQVEVHSIEICDWQSPVVRVVVDCGPGTYVRSIAHDLGEKLGCGAYLHSLIRLRSGCFCLPDALTIDDLREAFELDYWRSIIYPLDAPIRDWPAVILDDVDEQRIRNGMPISVSAGKETEAPGRLTRAYSAGGFLVALLRAEDAGWLRPAKVFETPGYEDRND